MQIQQNYDTVPRRILSNLMTALSAGVVPRSGAPYIAIGRQGEVKALLSDLEIASEGGSTVRFLIGKYGSGKSFLLQLIRNYANEQGFVTSDCDLSPERRLCSGAGSGLATYRELICNMAVKACPDGGALPVILSRWISSLQSTACQKGAEPGSAQMREEVQKQVYAVLNALQNCVGGFDFATAISAWYRGLCEDNAELQSAALRWLRGEYQNRTQARQYLEVGGVIHDDNWYDYLKLWSVFARQTGYAGFAVFIDECVNLYKISNRISREKNYEMILTMFNDAVQGRSTGMSLFFGGTPQFLEDTRRGLFSYEALRSRLADGRFAAPDCENRTGPVIRLRRLSDEELLALICRLSVLHGRYNNVELPVTDDDRIAFLREETSRAGAESQLTPREMIRDYMTVLNLLMQNPNKQFSDFVATVHTERSSAQPLSTEPNEIEF